MAAQTSLFCEALASSPNLALWPAQTVPVTIYAKVESPLPGITYHIYPRLYRGQHQGHFGAYDTSDDLAAPAVAKQAITTEWALYTFHVPCRELTGATSDRLFLYVVGEGGNDTGGYIHIGSDGGANQTAVYPNFVSTPFQPKSLRRNPDYGRPTQVVSYTAGDHTHTFYSLNGDPGFAIWKKRVWRPKLWATITGGTADIYVTIGRTSGAPIVLANDRFLANITSNSWKLYKKDILIDESTGSVTDVVFLSVRAVVSSGATLQVGVGLNHPSVINSPLLAFPGTDPTTGTFKDELVAVESGAPARFLRENVDSTDGSVTFGVTSDKRLDIISKAGSPSTIIQPADSYSGVVGTDSTKYAQEGHSHIDRGYVVAVDGDIPDVLYNRIVVRAPLNETVIGSAPIRQVELSITQQDPEVVGSYLYPAEIPSKKLQAVKCILAPLNRWDDVVCVFKTHIGGGEWGGLIFGGAWTEDQNGIWTCINEGDMPFDWFDGLATNEGGPIQVGTRVLAIDPAVPEGATEGRHYGIYEVLNLGWNYVDPANPHVTTQAQLRRVNEASAPSNFTFGKPVYVTSGSTWSGHTFRYSGIANPTVGLTSLEFYDAGTSSIFAQGFFGFGSVFYTIPGLFTWGKCNEIMGGGGPGYNQLGPGAPIFGLDSSGYPTIPINVGDKFLIWVDNDKYNESKYFGIYELVTTFENGSAPVIRRIDTVNEPAELTGIIANVDYSSSQYDGYFFEETATITTVDSDNTTWNGSTVPPNSANRLLTAAQLTTEGATNTTLVRAQAIGNGITDCEFFTGLPTLLGTPGLSSIPAGKYKFSIKAGLSVNSPSFETKVHIKLIIRDVNGSDSPSFMDVYSPPIRSVDPAVYTFEGILDEPVVCLPTDRISWQPWFSTNSTDSITASLVWQTRDRDTWVQTPIQFGSFGTLDHYKLDNRFPDVGVLDPPAHNWDGIGPTGFAHTAFTTATAAGGWLPSPTANNMLITVDGSNLLQGIGTADKLAGDIVICTFLQPLKVIHNASVSGHSGYAPLYLTWSGPNPQNIDWYTNTIATNRRKNCIAAFRLRTDNGISPSPSWELLYQKSGEPV